MAFHPRDSEDEISLSAEISDIAHRLFIVMADAELDASDVSNSVGVELAAGQSDSPWFSKWDKREMVRKGFVKERSISSRVI